MSDSTVKATKVPLKVKVQKFGNFLSGMVMPNIGAFIAWGLITAMFIPTGWIPNSSLEKLVDPMLFYLLPLLVAFSGGRTVYGFRGGVMATIATMGVIVGTDIPMFLGAMIMAPLAAWVLKEIDFFLKDKTPSGFEMLVDNFSLGILGMAFAILGFYAFGPAMTAVTDGLVIAAQWMVNQEVLPVVSLIVEPAKVLFLNNAINYSVFAPIGLAEVEATGQSVFFMIETNPGPGLGMLLAIMFFGHKFERKTAYGAAIIQSIGGIHEVYFPYILMRPILLLATIVGGTMGVLVNSMMGAGLVAPPSPGSIISFYTFTPVGGYFATTMGILIATASSFITAVFLLKFTKDKKPSEMLLEKAKETVATLKAAGKSTLDKMESKYKPVSKIVVACDAGMGSSALGASILRKKVKAAGLDIEVTNRSITNLTDDIDIVITQSQLMPRARTLTPNSTHLTIDNFVDNSFYDNLVSDLLTSNTPPSGINVQANESSNEVIASDLENFVKKEESKLEDVDLIKNISRIEINQIYLGLDSVSKQESIKQTADRLQQHGFVDDKYYQAMLDREELITTYIGNNTAIPHGTSEAKDFVIKTGIVILQYPNGIDFGNGNIAYLVIGIAAKNDDHLDIIANLANIIQDEELVKKLSTTKDINLFIESFTKQEES